MTTVAPAPTCGPKLESLSHIDISKLSQSELHALSLCSDSAYDLRRTNDVVIPQLDRSLFNESAGSRRQTYSRLRHQHHRSRVPGLHPSTSKPKPPSSSDPENHSIMHFLKFFIHNPNSDTPPPPPPPLPPPPLPPPITQPAISGVQEKTLLLMNDREKNRKRGRKAKDKMKLKENDVGVEVEIVNKNGEVVDLKKLENNGDELYSGELEKRTAGLQSEEEVLGFVRDLEGAWCSRRKRRKYVDASGFGDTLPVGWKLLLALRRRDGRVWVYCRRYVSPTSQQFISCKEASSYLRSHFSSGEANQLTQQADDTVSKSVSNFRSNTSLVLSTDIQENSHSLQEGDLAKHGIVAHSVVPSSSTLDLRGNEISLMDMDNLPEVKVQDIFECYKCNLTFEEKNAYLQHLFSFHQRTTRRYRVGPSVGDGVIIRDGKYECQFCHKVFEERRSYNGHVGVHVRNNARGTVDVSAAVAADKRVQSPHQDGLLLGTCKMDSLIEIAQNSVVETSSARAAMKVSSMPSSTTMNFDGSMPTNIDQVVRPTADTGLSDARDFKAETCHEQGRNQPDKTCMEVDKDKSGEILANNFYPRVISTNDSEQPESDEAKEAGSDKPMVGLGKKQMEENDDLLSGTMELTFQEIASQNALTSSSVSMVQSLHNDSEHSEDAGIKKDGTDKVAAGNGNSLTKANDVESETMELTFQENATLNRTTSSSVSMAQLFRSDSEHSESDDMKKDENKLAIGLGNNLTKANNEVESETMEFTLQQNASQDGLASFSEPMAQSFHNFTGILSGSSKDNGEFSAIGQNLDSETGFDELRLDEIEHFKYSFDIGHASSSLPSVSIGLGNDARMEEVFASVEFDSGGIILNMEEPDQLSTVCVWCRAEFQLEAYDTEAHSDSIGFMCPDCKAKISGHLEGGLSMSPHNF
uniref:Uncharacterized protein isoform X1 n=1 Tax=Nicotiana tabacum TaxID=4097 RepID=A0A1S4CME7_TOBAC|nr:PREDICTED: uncharacterized protein LOC107820446 isoform X1 [Nicotiana tabacum]XP_016502221.1 PREDICTED: uncharacterized protein LOC107820446 isoform X1 [Nicotiana tabacum]